MLQLVQCPLYACLLGYACVGAQVCRVLYTFTTMICAAEGRKPFYKQCKCLPDAMSLRCLFDPSYVDILMPRKCTNDLISPT